MREDVSESKRERERAREQRTLCEYGCVQILFYRNGERKKFYL